ncbi:acetolactate synthase, large subunit, biosynthetic type [Candidatus Saccharibacteria bacterium]|nr:MAG: acetolactate synthase, large subunit, biosynthetic type [Candidatus Saccharibacteria bacterium]
MSHAQTGAEALIRQLEANNVEYIFGYSGGAAIPIFDAIQTTKTNIKLIQARHEQGAAHMADGYARASGKPGVILVTSGPGAGNIITGLMTAHMDSVPLIAITGQQIRPMLGLDAFQEADVFNLTMPVTKHNYLVTDVQAVPATVDEAFTIATSGRPGPVVIDLPKDVSSATFVAPKTSKARRIACANTPAVKQADAEALVDTLQTAKRPVIIAGHGVLLADAWQELREVSQRFDTPVVTTLLGKGAVDETSPLAYGMLGMHGTAYANNAVLKADAIISVGSRFDDRIIGDGVSFGKDALIVHIDIDRAEHGKMIRLDRAIHANAKDFLAAVLRRPGTAKHSNWRKQLNDYRRRMPLIYNDAAGLTQQHILEAIDSQTNSESIVTTDVGQHQMWAAQFCRVKHPHHWISSGGAGTMGFGLPSALGAQLAQPGKQVISIVGDGGFQMTEYELATAAVHQLPIKLFIMNNHYLGMVRQWQELFYENRLSGVDMEGNPDFVALAASYGIKAMQIDGAKDVESVVAKALRHPGPVVINCEVIKEDNVYPMIPAGRGYDSMLTSAPTTTLEKPVGST